jgi:hypothetical protein
MLAVSRRGRAVVSVAIAALNLLGCDGETKNQRAEQFEKEKAAVAKRIAEGATIQSVTKISEEETVKVIRVPDESYGSLVEKTCVIYTHERLRVAQLSCDTSREFVDLTVDDQVTR